MSYTNVHNNTVPVFVVFQTIHNTDDDDVDSILSFATGSTSFSSAARSLSTVGTGNSFFELELVEDSSDCPSQQQQQATTTKRRLSTEEGPQHPQRSLSENTPVKPVNPVKVQRHHPSRTNNGIPKRLERDTFKTTRLTRMAERAKAVARTPRKSFLPSTSHGSKSKRVTPVRQKSSSLRSRRSSLGSKHSYCVDSFSSSSLSPLPPSTTTTSPTLKTMTPIRRRNSIQCVIPAKKKSFNRRRDGLLCPSRSTGRGLEAMISSVNSSRRSGEGCHGYPMRSMVRLNRPPRLPQRYPSEIMVAGGGNL